MKVWTVCVHSVSWSSIWVLSRWLVKKEVSDEAHKLVINLMTFQNVSVNCSAFARVINLKQKMTLSTEKWQRS